MDRLNDIIRNSQVRRQILSDQRTYPDSRDSQGSGSTPRRSLSDQTAPDSEQRYSQESSPTSYSHTSNRGRHLGRHSQSEERKASNADRLYNNEPTTNTDHPTYPSTMPPGPVLQSPLSQAVRRAPISNTPEYRSRQQTHQQPHQDQPNIQPLQPRPTSNYYPHHPSDVSGRGLQGDAIQSGEWEANGIVYGDWEGENRGNFDEDDDDTDNLDLPSGDYHLSTGYLPRPTVDTEPTPRITQQRYEAEKVSRRSSSQIQPSSYSGRSSRTHSRVPSHQKVTQPLDPRLNALALMRRERENLRVDSHDTDLQHLNHSALAIPEQEIESEPEAMVNAALIPVAPAVCPKCRGAGYLRANVPYGHPNFGKPIACECKEAERKEKRRQQLLSMSNMDAFRNHKFESFNHRISGVGEAYESAVAYAQEPSGWLVLVGPNGCGKTHLAASIANQLLDQGAVVLFEAAPDLLDHLRAAFAPTATEVYDQLFTKMREAEMLILDDLGAQQSSPWANEKLFQLLNYRYNLGMPTVITANQKGIQAIDERIRSRLGDSGLVIYVNMERTADYRPRNKNKDKHF